jgi:hypothetical protein
VAARLGLLAAALGENGSRGKAPGLRRAGQGLGCGCGGERGRGFRSGCGRPLREEHRRIEMTSGAGRSARNRRGALGAAEGGNGPGRSDWERKGDGPVAGPCGEGREGKALARAEREGWAGLAHAGERGKSPRRRGRGKKGIGLGQGFGVGLLLFLFLFYTSLIQTNII